MKKQNFEPKKTIIRKPIIFALLIFFSAINISWATNPPADSETLNRIGLPYDEITHKITYTDVIVFEGVSKKELMNVAQEAIKLGDRSTHFTIVTNNKESSKFTIKGSYEVVYRKKSRNHIYYDLIYTLKIETKDGKYRYTFTDFELFNKEKKRVVGKSSYNELLGSSKHFVTGTGDIETTPLEEFLAKDSRRKKGAKIYDSFQSGINGLIVYLNTYISKETSAGDDW